VTRVGILVLLFICWPGMVPNQRQLSIGDHIYAAFSHLFVVGPCFCVVAVEHCIYFTLCLFCIVLVSFIN
jgi:hypothetical protein